LEWQVGWPSEGIAFDIEHNIFWLDAWGPKPDGLQGAIEIARHHVMAAPTLIPVYSHRYLPAEPVLAGNPVFSVHEFGSHDWYAGQRYADWTPEQYHAAHRRIRFWSDLVS
jgi:hypothetical protein